ncbi:hypothetical protein I3760_05G249500 [Carya illinoinensis]|nr:hypothetical protein I3760_05G249500 [Carya illinoinensis]
MDYGCLSSSHLQFPSEEMMLDELEVGGKVYPVIEQSKQLPQLHATSADLEVTTAGC